MEQKVIWAKKYILDWVAGWGFEKDCEVNVLQTMIQLGYLQNITGTKTK